MSTTSKVAIDIVTAYKGANEVKKAQNSFNLLDQSLNKLGKKLAATFAAGEIAKFAKESVSAFAADQASAVALNRTLQNVGQGFANSGVEKFIKNTETASGILDEQLRPALSTLIRATGDYKKAEDLLGTSLDVSRGSGKDLASVTSALGKAYLGQTTALAKLGVGLTSAQLKGKAFTDIQKQLNSLFGGQSAAFADSYAGKIAKLGVSFDNVKEIIGKGLVDAFSTLAQNTNVDSFTGKMEATATAVADIARGIADIGVQLKNLPGLGILGKLASFAYKNSILGYLQSRGANDRAAQDALANEAASTIHTRGAGRSANQDLADSIAKQKAADAAKLAGQLKVNKAKADQLKLDQASALLNKQKAIFDLQKAEIAAAMQNDKLTADERLRLQMMATQDQLAAAIQEKNVPAVDALSKALTDLQATFDHMVQTNPFSTATQGAIALQSALYGLNAQLQANRGKNPLGGSYDLSNYAGSVAPVVPGNSGTTVNVTVNGAATHEELAKTIQDAINNNTASGVPSTYDRNKLVAW